MGGKKIEEGRRSQGRAKRADEGGKPLRLSPLCYCPTWEVIRGIRKITHTTTNLCSI